MSCCAVSEEVGSVIVERLRSGERCACDGEEEVVVAAACVRCADVKIEWKRWSERASDER